MSMQGKKLRFAAAWLFILLALLPLAGCQTKQYDWISTTKLASGHPSGKIALLSVSDYDELVSEMEELMRIFVPEVDVLIRDMDKESLPSLLEQAKQHLSESAFGAYAQVDIMYDVITQNAVPIARFTLHYGRPLSESKQLAKVAEEAVFWQDVTDCILGLTRSLDREILFEPEADVEKELAALILNLPEGAIGFEDYTLERFTDKNSHILSLRFKYVANNVTLLSARGETRQVVQEIIDPIASVAEHVLFYRLYFALLDWADYSVGTILTGIGPVTNTAYGPLVYGQGTSKGFAQALKLLCDEAGMECYVISGRKNGRTHYWNLVSINGMWYHTDPAEGDRERQGFSGLYFLFNDDTADTQYKWTYRPEGMECTGKYYTYERIKKMMAETP
jgi:transglutaminase/protease-like cytokinesis protein 3